jgi:uncharacterized protein DUF6445
VKPQLLRFGNSQSPVVVVDDFSGSAEDVARLADALAPFPPITGNYYPGLRRVISEGDAAAYAYVLETCRQAAPFIGGGFEVDGFDLAQGSFSLVTLQPHELQPVQRAPHFDSPDQNYLALLHYLRVPPGSGTAFYRHRATRIECVTESNLAMFVSTAKAEAAKLPPDSGYMHGSNDFYEQIGAVEGIPDRLIIYHSNLLHSGIIPPGMSFSGDPRHGRLTANLFLRGR